jgi:hypothetical protein
MSSIAEGLSFVNGFSEKPERTDAGIPGSSTRLSECHRLGGFIPEDHGSQVPVHSGALFLGDKKQDLSFAVGCLTIMCKIIDLFLIILL